MGKPDNERAVKARPAAKVSSKVTSTYTHKRNVKKLVIWAAFGIIGISLVWTLISQQFTISSQNKEINALESRVQEVQQQSDNLKQQVDNLENPEYIERIAREQLGLVRPNERVFVDSNKSEDNNSK